MAEQAKPQWWKYKKKRAKAKVVAEEVAAPPPPVPQQQPNGRDDEQHGESKSKKKRKAKKHGADPAHPAASAATAEAASADEPPRKKKKRLEQDACDAAAEPVTQYPFEVVEDDHCETTEEAYKHIAPLLIGLAAALGKEPSTLAIYDPYYCEGGVKKRLKKLGFDNVYNENEDFYEVIASGRIQPHDVVLTNPPYSGQHIPRILNFCAGTSNNKNSNGGGGKPWLLLLPNFVYMHEYFARETRGTTVHFLTPPGRYHYHSPRSARQNVRSAERKTSPFLSFWYCGLGSKEMANRAISAFLAANARAPEELRCHVASRAEKIPFRFQDSNDPLRKKQRDREKRKKRPKKKKKSEGEAEP